MSQDNVNEER